MAINDESILTSIKQLLGVEESYTVFDLDILTHINSMFSTLHQLGLGPNEGFMIESKTEKWSAFIDDNKLLASVKTFIYIKVRLVWDPPDRSFVIEALQKQADEIGWRLNAAVDPPAILNT